MQDSKYLNKLLNDLRVALFSAFDENFERKAFFSSPWKERLREGKGTLLDSSGALRKSIRHEVEGTKIVYSSSLPYATIHNEGGDIIVTARMKRFFWAKYYELAGKIKQKRKGKVSKKQASLIGLAEFYRSMAFKPVGSTIHIPKRQFIGFCKETDDIVKKVFYDLLTDFQITVKDILKKK